MLPLWGLSLIHICPKCRIGTAKFFTLLLLLYRTLAKQAGIKLLQDNKLGLRIFDYGGHEVFSYGKFEQVNQHDANTGQLYQIEHCQNGETSFFCGEVTYQGNNYVYILYFPMEIKKVTMYLNGARFSGGKTIIIAFVALLFLVILMAGFVYGLWTTQAVRRLTASMQDIAKRCYLPVQNHGAFGDIYDSLNTLNAEIKASDKLWEQTEKMREEWIANITHDLKTPLSPIKGYAEILSDDTVKTAEQCKRYAQIMLKNVAHMETLLDDLKLTYLLENNMVPIHCQEQNLVRFLKELVIDILNNPQYESRTIHFESTRETILFVFDPKLLRRALQNLIINAFVHGDKNTEITLQISMSDHMLQIVVADNGKGMTVEESSKLFQRYYRGTNTEQQPEGTGLGLAIAKNIVELHKGTISVSSVLAYGTTFQIRFPHN